MWTSKPGIFLHGLGADAGMCWHVLADASLVALTRIVGIVGGVMLMLMLSVLVFPKSASHQVCHQLPLLQQKRRHDMRVCSSWACEELVHAVCMNP